METMTKNDFIRWLAEVKEHAKKARPGETGVLVPFEADGATHNSLKQKQKDKERDDFLAQAGITVLRFKPASKIDFDGLCRQVENLLEKSGKM